MSQCSLHSFFERRTPNPSKSNCGVDADSEAAARHPVIEPAVSKSEGSSGGFPAHIKPVTYGRRGLNRLLQEQQKQLSGGEVRENSTESTAPKTPALQTSPLAVKKRFREDTSGETVTGSPLKARASGGSVNNHIDDDEADADGGGTRRHVGFDGATDATNSPSSIESAKRRKRFLEAVGEEDYAAAGKAGAWAEARRSIEWLHPARVRDGNGRRPGEPGYDKRTVTVPPEVLKGKSKSQRQYWETKCKYMDTLLFFKVGKFYELYELDAEIGHRELDWKLTVSGVGKCLQVGVPESGVEDAVRKLVARGYKVGRMEQVETGEEAKAKRGPQAMVKRVLTQVQTPATVAEDLQPEAVHLLAIKEVPLSLHESGSQGVLQASLSQGSGAVLFGFAFADAAAGRFYVGSMRDDSSRAALTALLMQVAPQEILYEVGGVTAETRKAIRTAKGPGLLPLQATPMNPGSEFLDPEVAVQTLDAKGFFQPMLSGTGTRQPNSGGLMEVLAQLTGEGDPRLAGSALSALVFHLQRFKLDGEMLPHGQLLPYEVYMGSLRLDGQTLRNLELLENIEDGSKNGSLFNYLDSCSTPTGKRLLRRWICRPLRSVHAIEERLDAVDELISQPQMAASLSSGLRRLPDIERLIGRMRSMAGTSGVGIVPMAAGQTHKKRLKAFAMTVKGTREACNLLADLKRGFDGSPPTSSLLVAAVRILENNAALEMLEEVGAVISWPTNKRDGVTLRVEAMEHLSEEVEDEDEDSTEREARMLSELLRLFNEHTLTWTAISEALARIDVLLAFAAAATSSEGAMCRPTFVSFSESNEKDGAKQSSMEFHQSRSRSQSLAGSSLDFGLDSEEEVGAKKLKEGAEMGRSVLSSNGESCLKAVGLWHPYAVGGGGGAVVSNDVTIGMKGTNGENVPRAMLLTGPNMGGKSTLLRAVCLGVIMAQLGSHVAAESFILSPVDTIFTRLGASDRIMSGESTFMVECNEAASVLHHATKESLVVLDELGRGTSTFDGYSIAYAVLKHLTETLDCRLLFATHYHPLTAEFAHSPYVSLRHMACLFRSENETLEGDSHPCDGEHQTERKRLDDGREGPSESSPESGFAVGPPNEQLVFLYKLKEGACPKSYGLQVAKLAGIPGNVVERAAQAAEKMHGQLVNTFDAATYGGGLLDLHREWLLGVLDAQASLIKAEKNGGGGEGSTAHHDDGNSAGLGIQEDGMDTMLCIWSEMMKSAI